MYIDIIAYLTLTKLETVFYFFYLWCEAYYIFYYIFKIFVIDFDSKKEKSIINY